MGSYFSCLCLKSQDNQESYRDAHQRYLHVQRSHLRAIASIHNDDSGSNGVWEDHVDKATS